MTITFALNNSLYDCQLEITDAIGTQCHTLYVTADESPAYLTVDISGSSFDVQLTPMKPLLAGELDEWKAAGLLDRVVKTAAKALLSALNTVPLLVSCAYHADGVQDGDRLDIALQCYAFNVNDKYDLLELNPVMYIFFELADFNRRLAPVKAFSINRKAFLKAARAITFTDLGVCGLLGLIVYPLQMWRARHLSKNGKIRRVLTKFHRMSDEKRQKYFEKLEEP